MSTHDTKLYVVNAIWLTVLTVLELGVGNLPVPKSAQVALLLAFAATKMILVAMVYMHLRYETRALKIVVCVPIPLAVLFCVSLIYDLPYQMIY